MFIDGKTWNATSFFNSNLLYAKGLSYMNCSKPYLMLGFKATQSPDNRQLTFAICGSDMKTGKVAIENIEINFGGAAMVILKWQKF
ncbi:MAG: hypothetical protein HC854_02520 [Flavobacterium sp.]|nr:hypothetical protein [Flavobacterium sp.]